MTSPFGEVPVQEIRLERSPLERVFCQVQFPRLTELVAGSDGARTFASRLSPRYPILEERKGVAFEVTPEGVKPASAGEHIWQLRSGDDHWQVTFSNNFLAIHTDAYTTRGDFTDRFRWVLGEFFAAVSTPYVVRVGFRYLNLLQGPDVISSLPSLVRPEVLGGVAVAGGHSEFLQHSVSESLFLLDGDVGLQTRWGVVPEGAVLDLSVPPVTQRTWVLDIDAFTAGQMIADPDGIADSAAALGLRAYRFFRWVVTDAFLDEYGAVR